MEIHLLVGSLAISVIFNLVTFIVILFLIPKSGKIEKIYEMLHSLDMRVKTPEEINDIINLKIFQHKDDCPAYKKAIKGE